MVRMNLSIVASQFVLVSFRETTPPRLCRGEQKGFRCQFRAKQDSINTKRCSTQREEPRLREAGQVMQEAGYPVPLERLAGSMPFQGLRKPQP